MTGIGNSRAQNNKLIAAMSVALLQLLALPAYCEPSDKGWILRQNNTFSPGTGAQTVTVTAANVKAASADFTIYTKGPGKPLWIYSHLSREYVDQPYETWMKKFGAKDPKLTGKELVKTGTASLLGLKVTKYVRYCYMPGHGRIATKEFWLTDAMKLPVGMINCLRSFAGLPPGEGIPLRVIGMSVDHHRHMLVDTLQIKQSVIPISAFNRPSGYKRAESEMAMLMHSSRGKEFTDLLDESPSP